MSEQPIAVTETTELENPEDYDAKRFKYLKDAAHIRLRPGMYIGDTATNGLHHLVYELVYNSVDEALSGYCKTIQVTIHADSSLSVGDDGRGIPVEIHPEVGVPTLQMIMTMAGSGAKFDKRSYKTSTGLHGMGAKAVNALSEWTEAEVRRGGRVFKQEYERGKATTEVVDFGAATTTGTTITFKPDPEIFKEATFNYDTLEGRLRELAFLNKGLHIKLADERLGRQETFKYTGGLAEYVEYLNRSEDVLHKPIHIEKTVDDIRVELAIQYTTSDEDRTRCYTNNAYNPVGGTHMSGFRAGLTRTLNAYGTKENLFKNNLAPIGEDFREGITAIVSVSVPEPQFESNNKLKLNNPEVDGIVASVVNEQLGKFLEENPKDAQKIMKKVVIAAEAREAAAKAKKALKDRKSVLNSGGLPGKLMDCTTRDSDESELFLVEGDSAGGSAEGGRDRMYQAILPLRGKPLNVEKAREEKLMSNEEICSIISAVGIDIVGSGHHDVEGAEPVDALEKLRYSKIVILTDADVDGQHIRTLLLTFFYRQMPKLLENGHVYVARPPLYKVAKGAQKKNARYVQTTEAMSRELMARGLDGTHLKIGEWELHKIAAADAPAPKTDLEGDRLAQLVKLMDEVDAGLQVLERSGVDVARFIAAAGPKGLPTLRIALEGAVYFLADRDELPAFKQQQTQRLKRAVEVVEETLTGTAENGQTNGAPATGVKPLHALLKDLHHQVKPVARALDKLKEQFAIDAQALLALPRVGGREPVVRFVLESGEQRRPLTTLRELVLEVRRLGEKGLSITRFKGLGEMDPEELWETTLDPKRRTLLQVQLEDALKADEMFRILMGEKVEPRRDFIQKHALEVKEIDYHGA